MFQATHSMKVLLPFLSVFASLCRHKQCVLFLNQEFLLSFTLSDLSLVRKT